MMADGGLACGACGEINGPDGRFCVRCGYALSIEAAIAPQYGYCAHCGGDGQRLAAEDVFCPVCRWLRPLGRDYHLPLDAFMWSLDAQAMGVLRSIAPLNAAAQALSNRIGRPWFESTVNGIRLGMDQLPDIFEKGVLAARIMGLPVMPEIYVSGDAMWESSTLGSDTSAFITLGSVLTNLKDDDLLYVLGREMGHCAAHHALWKTVLQFIGGKKQLNHSLMGQGVLQLLNPSRVLESAIDTPLMAWARHAEITADRAGALVVRNAEVVRKVTTQWAVRSFPLYNRLNLDALERQMSEANDRALQLAEWTQTATPFLTRRLRFMSEYTASDAYRGWAAIIDYWLEQDRRQPDDPEAGAASGLSDSGSEPDDRFIRLACTACSQGLKVPFASFGVSETVKIRCPNEACGRVLEVRRMPPRSARIERVTPEPKNTLRLTCVACHQPLRAPRSIFAAGTEVLVRCPNPACAAVLTVKPPAPEKLPVEPTSPPAHEGDADGV